MNVDFVLPDRVLSGTSLDVQQLYAILAVAVFAESVFFAIYVIERAVRETFLIVGGFSVLAIFPVYSGN